MTNQSADHHASLKKYAIGAAQVGAVFLFLVVAAVFSRPPSVDDILSESGEVGGGDTPQLIVKIATPRRNTTELSITSTGNVRARNIVTLASQVTGRVEWIAEELRTGGTFVADQPLLHIEKSDFELGVAQAKANLDTAKANLKLRHAERTASTEAWQLVHPRTDVPTLVAKEPQIAQSEASIATAEAGLKIAELQLSRTVFALPFHGSVIATDIGVGQLLTQGQPFGTVYDSGTLEVHVAISESELRLLEPANGRRALVHRNGDLFEAVVERTSSMIDPTNRTATLYLGLVDDNDLLPGHFVHVDVYGRNDRDTYRLPESAEQPNSSVWIVRDSRLERVYPEIISRDGREMVVAAFDYGDGIVVETLMNAYAGMKVAIAADRS